jgi:hypothetical protein
LQSFHQNTIDPCLGGVLLGVPHHIMCAHAQLTHA